MHVTFITIILSELLKLRNYRDTRAYILDLASKNFKYKILIFWPLLSDANFSEMLSDHEFFFFKKCNYSRIFFQCKNRTFLPSKCKSDVGMMLRYPHFHPNGAFFVIAVMLLLIMSNWVFGSA